MTNAQTVALRIVTRENMPAPQDVHDGAGITGAGGQTQPWCQQWGVPFPTNELTAQHNLEIWLEKSGLDAVVAWNLAAGDCVADWAYNSGEDVAIRAFQIAVGVFDDGEMGPLTREAMRKADPVAVTTAVATARVAFIKTAVAAGEIGAQFEQGLLNRASSFL
jgi:lysozyme family protein